MEDGAELKEQEGALPAELCMHGVRFRSDGADGKRRERQNSFTDLAIRVKLGLCSSNTLHLKIFTLLNKAMRSSF